MSTNLDLLEHYALHAEELDGSVIHKCFVSDPPRGLRKVEVKEIWDNVRIVGHGSFGEVWLQKRRDFEAKRAVKVLRKYQMQYSNVDYKRELEALAKFDKSQTRQEEVIVKFFGWWETGDNVYLSMEYFSLGDLSNYIGSISERDAKDIVVDLLRALVIIHSEGFTHRDLKPQNIFVAQLSPTYWVKIGDFGIAKRVTNGSTALRTEIGTPYFSAPETQPDDYEYQEHFEYTNVVDIWSLGCVIYNILAQRPPFRSRRAKISPFPMQPLEGKINGQGIDLLNCMLRVDPSARWTAREALEHSWLQPNSADRSDRIASATRGQDSGILQIAGLDLENPSSRPNTEVPIAPDPTSSLDGRAKAPHIKYDEPELSDLSCKSANHGCDIAKEQVMVRFEAATGIDVFESEVCSGPREGVLKKDERLRHVTYATEGTQAMMPGNMDLIDCFRGRDESYYDVYRVQDQDTTRALQLMNGGIDLGIKDQTCKTALHWSVMKYRRATSSLQDWSIYMVIEELLVRGADVNAKDRELRSPLHWAMPQPNEIFEDDSIRVPVVRLLLKHEADIDARDSLGRAPIHMASRYGRGDIVAVLLEHGLDVNARDFEMRTALHRASKALFGRASAHRLLEAGADMHAADQTGQTPLQIAEAPGNETLREIFHSYRQSSPLES